MKLSAPYVAAGIVVGAALVYVVSRGAGALGKDLGGGLVDAADGVITGVVEALGNQVGVPPTNADQCSADIAAGRTWDASFSCPAKRFISYVFGG